MTLPLEGIRVIDLTTVAMGPLASQWLGDFGAEVIKIESPCGDSTRQTGPSVEDGMAAVYLSANRNKKSVVLDLKEPAAREALLALIDEADVFMHNIRPQKLGKLGLEPQSVVARNPRLVYAGLHGFGAAGPYGGMPAYDDVIQGLAGCADLMRRQTGEPQYFPTVIADKTVGLIAAMAILAALTGRASSGKGTIIEVPMFECMASFNLFEHLYGRQFSPARGEMGYPRVLSRHRRPYRTRDGYICILPYTDAHWRAFFAAAGAKDEASDARFATIAARTANIDALYQRTADLVAEHDTGFWLDACERAGVPVARVSSLDDLIDDPHLNAVGFFSTIVDPDSGALCVPGVPVLFDGVRPPVATPPRLGQHNREVLGAWAGRVGARSQTPDTAEPHAIKRAGH